MARKKQSSNTIKDRAIEAVDAAKEKIGDMREQAEDYVKERPFTSTMVAAAVGAVVGAGVTLLLLHPRKKSIFDLLREFI